MRIVAKDHDSFRPQGAMPETSTMEADCLPTCSGAHLNAVVHAAIVREGCHGREVGIRQTVGRDDEPCHLIRT